MLETGFVRISRQTTARRSITLRRRRWFWIVFGDRECADFNATYASINSGRASSSASGTSAKEREDVPIEHVAVVLERRRLEVPSREVLVDKAAGEVAERDSRGLPEPVLDGREPLPELALGLALVPRRLRTEGLLDLLPGGVAVLDPPDRAPRALVANDGSAPRHLASFSRYRRHAGSCG
jgi:hypothetical protein